MRYKIFMSESLLEKFLNIGDGNGHGKDHCEFVGAASEAGVDCDSNFWKSPSTTGYYRSKWGQIIQKGNIGGHPQWTGKYYGKWCECGIAIPGTKQVMNYVGTGTLSVKSTTTSYLTTPIKKSTTAVTWKETEGSHVNFAIPILSCELQQDSSTAAATHPPVSGGYSTFSCTPCDKGQYEVHVINIYEPTGSSRGFRQEPTNVVTVPVEIKSQKAVDIKLVFINYEAAHWVITKPSYVNILAVNLVAYYHTSTTVRLSNNINSTLSVEKVHDYYSGWKEICKVQNYVINKYGYMSSFTGVYKSSSFVLTVGTCDVSTTTTVDPSTIDCTKCLSRKDCWLKYQFSYDNNWNDCHGDQYVTMYQQYYVGVVVCTNAKYKIFISESLTGRYLNVGDEKSFSRNHCEFVGAASEAMADHFYQGSPAPNVTGYYRSTWGANILKGEIGGTHRWGIYYVKYYECGVCIPGSKIVVDFNDADSCLTSMSTSMSTGDATSADLIACRVKQIGGKKMKPGDMFKRKCPGNYKCKVKGPVVIIDGQKNKIKYCDIPFEFPNEGMACKIEYDNGATATLKKCPEDWSCSAGPFDGTDSQYYVCIPDEANGKLKLKHHIEAQLINRACRVGTKVKKSCPDNEPCDGAIITVCDKKAQFCRGPGDEGFSYLKLYSIRAQD